jgi:Tfp pilus assembly protein PilN
MPTQQVNLLRREARVPASLGWGLLALVIWGAGLAGWGWWLDQQNRTLARALNLERAQVEGLRSALAARRQPPAAINRAGQSLDDLRQQMRPHVAMLSALEKGELGTDTGPVFLFRRLSSLAGRQVWLTSVSLSLSQDGLFLRLSGLADNQAEVVNYQEQLSQALEDHRLRLVALDSASEAETGAAAQSTSETPTVPAQSRIRFSLASR